MYRYRYILYNFII